MQALLESVGEACASAGTGLAMFVDELQRVPEDDLAALIVALHRTAQRQLPVTLVGAGLPQLRGRMGRAKSYAERLFDFPEVGPLPPEAATVAITKPAADRSPRSFPLVYQDVALDNQFDYMTLHSCRHRGNDGHRGIRSGERAADREAGAVTGAHAVSKVVHGPRARRLISRTRTPRLPPIARRHAGRKPRATRSTPRRPA